MRLYRGIPGIVFAVVLCGATAVAGPYSLGWDDPSNAFDAPVPGFVGPHGEGKARLWNGVDFPNNSLNPVFFGWAGGWQNYVRSDKDLQFNDPSYALGPVTGDNFDVVSLGDMTAAQITASDLPGRITLTFAKPIANLSGADFVIFENSFVSQFTTPDGSQKGKVFAELAYVEVSSDGVNFVRFPSASLSPSAVGSYGTIDPSNVRNLAGKHVNAYGDSWGTPFDLSDVGLTQITHVRVVDIPGNGSFLDAAGRPIFDSWRTFGSGGFDLEAVGAIAVRISYPDWPALQSLPGNQRGALAEPAGDGVANLLKYAFAIQPGEAARKLLPRLEFVEVSGQQVPELVFRRDERLADLTYEVQASENLTGWTPIASSVGGSAMQALPGGALAIQEASASSIASVGVIREVRVRDAVPVGGKRFLRVVVARNP